MVFSVNGIKIDYKYYFWSQSFNINFYGINFSWIHLHNMSNGIPYLHNKYVKEFAKNPKPTNSEFEIYNQNIIGCHILRSIARVNK